MVNIGLENIHVASGKKTQISDNRIIAHNNSLANLVNLPAAVQRCRKVMRLVLRSIFR